ncbi:MAG: hypothetical protein WCI71_02055 [Bacteroidota bacterium]
MRENYNEKGDFAISLRFNGVEILSDDIATYGGEGSRCSFLVPVFFVNREKESYLMLTTVGDIFEFEIVRDIRYCCIGDCFLGYTKKGTSETGEKEFCPNRLFRDEAYIPDLLTTYDSLSMNVVVADSRVIVTYKKN